MLSVRTLHKSFASPSDGGSVKVLDDVSFTVPAGSFFTLLGPSGCGKTTTMRSIAGLETPDDGSISIGGITVFDGARGIYVPPNKRQIGMVFQSYAIWPHMDVFDNVAFPLKVTGKLKSADIRRRVERALETVQLETLGNRPATRLSGGQQQRLALARALVVEPDLLLLDEPLSNLDAQLRDTMRSELRRLQREVGVTTIFVTHDQTEALALSDQIAVINKGAIVQIGEPQSVYERPQSRFVATFLGSTNLLPATLAERPGADGIGRAETAHGHLACVFAEDAERAPSTVVSIRPENILLAAQPVEQPGLNRFGGTIHERVYVGDSVEYIVKVGETLMRARGTPHERFNEGQAIQLHMRAHDCLALPGE
ncbi:MAG TPA: ABC transporter ATP-binding protein [Stellaceae bacterium]|jgi:iron(III) transport system ATP-binding protein|nr:ABC transporter ATP-binding protein [Stellaceae bacterium]